MTYTNHLNETIRIGKSEDWHTLETDLHDYLWSYEDSAGFVSAPYRSPQEKLLKIGLWCKNEKQALVRRNALTDIMEEDTLANREGTLRIGSWYLKCMVIGSTKAEWHFADHIMEAELTLLCKKPVWWKDVVHEFYPQTAPIAGDFLDYEFDYDYDYSYVSESQVLRSAAKHASYFKLVIYGYVANPSVKIGNNIYQVNVTVPIGGLLIIDSRDRTVILRDPYGTETSVYDKRLRGASGSGQYIFEPIPAGDSSISWSQAYGFSLTICRDRSEPEWT